VFEWGTNTTEGSEQQQEGRMRGKTRKQEERAKTSNGSRKAGMSGFVNAAREKKKIHRKAEECAQPLRAARSAGCGKLRE